MMLLRWLIVTMAIVATIILVGRLRRAKASEDIR